MIQHFGFDPFNHVRFPNCRDTRYLGAAIVVGKGLNARAHMNANAGNEDTPNDYVWKPDPEKKAKEFGVDMVVANTGRIWTFDQGECQYGYGWDIQRRQDEPPRHDGRKGPDRPLHGPAYVPTLLTRLTRWTWDAGKEVFILRDPEGTVWVMQEYTRDVDSEPDHRHPEEHRSQAEDASQGLDVRDQGARKGFCMPAPHNCIVIEYGLLQIIRDEPGQAPIRRCATMFVAHS